jgi:hypothetical protein
MSTIDAICLRRLNYKLHCSAASVTSPHVLHDPAVRDHALHLTTRSNTPPRCHLPAANSPKRTKNVQNADFCMVVRLLSAESLVVRKMQMRCSA